MAKGEVFVNRIVLYHSSVTDANILATDSRQVTFNKDFLHLYVHSVDPSDCAGLLGLRVRLPPRHECVSLVSVVCCQVEVSTRD
jgi:hypothetical protein